MPNDAAPSQLDRLADQMTDLQILFWMMRHKRRIADPHDLTEPEFMVLDLLAKQDRSTVGQLQKALDVQPAQMSRIIRSLENKGTKRLVECQLNGEDKRRIDVVITNDGRSAQRDYRNLRRQANLDILSDLAPTDVKDVSRLLDRFSQIMSDLSQR